MPGAPTTVRLARLVAPLAIALAAAHAIAESRPTDPFRVADKPPARVHAARSAEPIPPDIARSPMLAALSGHLEDLDTQDLVTLRRALGNVPAPAALPGSRTLAVLHMSRGASSARAEVLHLADDRYAVRALDDPGADPRLLADAPVESLGIHRWSATPTQPLQPNARASFDGNADPSPVTLDRATRRRLFRANYPELTRNLADETIHIRTPRTFDPNEPHGILVWVSPSPDGRIPPMLEPALDELNLLAVGASNAGNRRELSDRLQLMLDAIETARRRMTTDESRIYVTGMSGGARCASILQIAMPGTFAGAVPIVGLDSYHLVPTGNGSTRWPARLGRPPAKAFAALKERRIRAITGDQDFNEPEMSRRARMMQKDGINIQLDVIEGMAHAMPTPERFAEALRWVDEPRRQAIAQAARAARDALDAIDPDATPQRRREALIEVTRIAPWSDPAWEAATQLGFEKPR